MLGKFIVSQIFGIPAAYVSSVAWASLFGTVHPAVPIATWLITSLYTIKKMSD